MSRMAPIATRQLARSCRSQRRRRRVLLGAGRRLDPAGTGSAPGREKDMASLSIGAAAMPWRVRVSSGFCVMPRNRVSGPSRRTRFDMNASWIAASPRLPPPHGLMKAIFTGPSAEAWPRAMGGVRAARDRRALRSRLDDREIDERRRDDTGDDLAIAVSQQSEHMRVLLES